MQKAILTITLTLTAILMVNAGLKPGDKAVKFSLRNVDETLRRSDILLDSDNLAQTLNNPKRFNSPNTQKMLKKYPKRTRTRLKELGMNAFMMGATVPENDIQSILGGN